MIAWLLSIAVTMALQPAGPSPRPEIATAGLRAGLPDTLQAKVEIETIVRDNMSGVEEARQTVARTEAEWSQLWRAHNAGSPVPKVDFSKRMVVAVFLGTRPSAGYAIEISGTKAAGKTLVVEWREFPPKPGNLSAQVLTSPAHLVTIPTFDGEVKFHKVER